MSHGAASCSAGAWEGGDVSRQRGFIARRDCGDVAAGVGEGRAGAWGAGSLVDCVIKGGLMNFWLMNSAPRVALPDKKEDWRDFFFYF